jgi:hypothetical protein
MNQTANIQKVRSAKESKEQFKRQLAETIAQQPEAAQSAHRWMNRLEAVAAGISVAAFVAALYLSFMWKSINPLWIPVAWFAFAATAAPHMILAGLDAMILRAFLTSGLLRNRTQLITGGGAVWIGAGFIVLAVVVVAFWGLAAYATWTQNWALLQPLIGFLGVLMAAAMLLGMAQKTYSKLVK